MTVNRKPTGTALSVPEGLAWGAVVSVVLTIGGAFLTAWLIDAQIIRWEQSGYGVLVILLIAAWAGAMTAAGKIKRKRALMCLASGGIYYAVLLLSTALFFGGQYSGAGETGLLIFCGSMLGLFTGFTGKPGRKTRKIRGINC